MTPRAPTSTVTFLFTDIEGSTRRWEESPAMPGQVERHFEVLRSAVEAAGGEIFATSGDGVATAFGSAHGAVEAAIDAQQQLREVGLAVRMGIHTGEIERSGDDFRGRPVNRAARVMAVAHGGQILLSDLTAALVRSGPCPPDLLDLGTHRLRDLAGPHRLWQVLHHELDAEFPPVRGVDHRHATVPVARTSLVGRELDVQRVTALLRQRRIVTLTGVGGVGKSRLAARIAADPALAPAQVWFVPLARVSSPGGVADAVALAVGASTVPDALAATAESLAGEPVLLVVDNCEHVLERAAELIDLLTARCPDLTVLATSRQPLGIDGEHVVALQPLEPSTTAMELFLERADAAGGDLRTVPRPAIQALCARLDGLPLAIELAAARTVTLGVTEIMATLDHHGSPWQAVRRHGDDRHRTVRATIDWSYRLLETEERRLLAWLAVFPNGFELDAARHVAGALGIAARPATHHLESLVHKSMVSVEWVAHGARYRLLETTRSFALERLDEWGERLAALSALAHWMTTIADAPGEEPCSASVERGAIRLEREADTWREAVLVAMRLGDGELAAGLCGPPANFFLLGRHDLADVARPLLEICRRPSQRRAVLCALIVSASGATSVDQLCAWSDEVQRIDELRPTGLGGLMRWMALAWRGDFAAAIEVCVASSLDLRLGRTTRDLFVGIATLDHFSLTVATDDRHGLVARALEVAERSEMALARVTCLLGVAWASAGEDPGRAVALVRQALSHIADVPALTRLTLPGSASRLLSHLEPGIAARALLEQLDGPSSGRSFVELIPLFYGAALLEQLGHDVTAHLPERLGGPPLVASVSMMDFVDQARRAAANPGAGSLEAIDATVRAGLAEVARVAVAVGAGAGTEPSTAMAASGT